MTPKTITEQLLESGNPIANSLAKIFTEQPPAMPKKKTKMQSPTKLTLAEMRKSCDAVQVVEHWNAFARVRNDLYGFVDVLCLRGSETIAVQSTSWSNVSARAKKIAESDLVGAVRKAGWTILIHGWRKSPVTKRYELKTLDVS